MRNMLCETRGRAILVIKWKDLTDFFSWSSVVWKIEFASDKIAYLAEEISKQVFKVGSSSSRVLNKMQEEGDEIKKELFIQQKGTKT